MPTIRIRAVLACSCSIAPGSMSGRPIDELNAGLQQFRSELLGDQLAARRVEIAVVPFGPVLRGSPFHAPAEFHPQPLTAGGDTPTGAAVEYAIELIARRKRRTNSTACRIIGRGSS